MRRLPPHFLSLVFIGGGIVLWTVASGWLEPDEGLRIPSNPLGLKRSPYGEVVAMAIQSPIETYWHGGDECHDEDCTDPSHHHGEEKPSPTGPTTPHTLAERFDHFLDEAGEAVESRTNTRELTSAQKFAIRREIETKLRFAYELDPSHYGNYAAYSFFLSEPALGTHPVLTEAYIKLAEETIRYCLDRNDDPRPSLTAAAAAGNELGIMFQYPDQYTPEQMLGVLRVTDHCLDVHRRISNEWVQTGAWKRVSPERQKEIAERLRFVTRLRNDAEATIARLAQKPVARASN